MRLIITKKKVINFGKLKLSFVENLNFPARAQ